MNTKTIGVLESIVEKLCSWRRRFKDGPAFLDSGLTVTGKRKFLQASAIFITILILLPIILLSSSRAQADGLGGVESMRHPFDAYRAAATLTVDTLTDENDGSCSDGDCSLRDALAIAQAGDTIDFSVMGTITLTLDQLTVGTDLTISGPGAISLTISGDDTYRVFWINEGISATLSGLTIADGYAQDGGGIFNRGGMLTLSHCTLSGNRATYDGGGIGNRFDGTLNVIDTLFTGNTAVRDGGSIDNRETLIVTDSTFDDNSAGRWGGGIYNYTGVVTVTGSTFSGNGEYTDVGGGICNHQGSFQLADSDFLANYARVSGGGIYNEAVLTVTGSDFFSNTTARGGGIHNTNEMTVIDSTFSNNSVTSNGGGIHNTSMLTVTGSTFYSNTAEYGGGIENFYALYVANTTFYSNTVADTGGGICSHGALTVTNSTFYSNTAGTRGGGINNNEGSLYVTNSTFSNNRAADSGGGIRNEEKATLINTIVADSLAGGNCAGSALDAASTNGLSTDATCAPGFTQTTGISLALNWQGWVFELITGSVAIDAGSNAYCPGTDQLGQHRPQDGDNDGSAICDVGSYELPAMSQCGVPLTDLHIEGPSSGTVGEAYAFTAIVSPLSATQPITYDWRPAPDSGTALLPTTHVATYTWPAVGPQTITLTVSNACNALTRTHTITMQPVKIFLPLVARSWPPMTWHTECVDCPPSIHSISQGGIAMDSAGRPHVAYGGVKLYHAWRDGSGWQVEVVDPSPQVGAWAAIDLDGDDHPHISYYNYDTDNLKYTHWDGSAWLSETVDHEGGWDSYIAIDSQGHPHIAYRDAQGFSGTAVKYAHWDGSAWQIDTLEELVSAISSRDTTLALDNDDLPHISYSVSDSGDDPDYLYHAYQQVSGGDWLTETVETAGYLGDNALALNSAGRPHIVYYAIDGNAGRLDHAWWGGGQWQHETLYDSDDSIEALSLVVDDSDVPHAGYYLGASDSMHYARRDGVWQTETVESDLLLHREISSLALDNTGQPHLIYLLENKTLKYAHREDATWQTEAIAEGGEPGRYSSIVLDQVEHPHIVYTDQDRMQLRYAAWDGETWQTQDVDQGDWDYAFDYAGLALDGEDRPHIAYNKDDAVWGDTLHYAVWDGGAWQTQALLKKEFGSASNAVALVLDSAERPHIVHGIWDGIAHTYWDGAAWQSETVDAQPTSSPSRLSLTIDGGDTLHLAYWDMTNEVLKYAYRDGAGWHVQTVDVEGRSPWIALDSADRPHISYCRIPGSYCEELRYARWDGAQWLTSTLESGSRTGFHTSLALDSADRPRISYYNLDEAAVKYAQWDGAAWQIETVGSGSYTALALDSAGRPHISYYTDYGLHYTWFGVGDEVPGSRK